MTAPMLPAPERPGQAVEQLVAGFPAHTVLSHIQLSTGVWFSVAVCGEEVTSPEKPAAAVFGRPRCAACQLSPAERAAIRALRVHTIEAVALRLEQLAGPECAEARRQVWEDLAQTGIGWRWHDIGPDGVLTDALRLLGGASL